MSESYICIKYIKHKSIVFMNNTDVVDPYWHIFDIYDMHWTGVILKTIWYMMIMTISNCWLLTIVIDYWFFRMVKEYCQGFLWLEVVWGCLNILKKALGWLWLIEESWIYSRILEVTWGSLNILKNAWGCLILLEESFLKDA